MSEQRKKGGLQGVNVSTSSVTLDRESEIKEEKCKRKERHEQQIKMKDHTD